jgi:hypothetical protein
MSEDGETSYGELRTVGNKWMHRDELSILCEQFFYKASELEVVMRYKRRNLITTFEEFIKLFFDMYYRFAEVSNNAVYVK